MSQLLIPKQATTMRSISCRIPQINVHSKQKLAIRAELKEAMFHLQVKVFALEERLQIEKV
jgi:hypothetical protein